MTRKPYSGRGAKTEETPAARPSAAAAALAPGESAVSSPAQAPGESAVSSPAQPGAPARRQAVARELHAVELATGYGKKTISEKVDLRIPVGKISTIVGANACGKSTLLKTLARIQQPLSGSVLLDGKSIREIPTKRLATKLGLLPQQPIAPEGMAVADLVGRGRHPHKKLLQSQNREDAQIIAEALDVTGTAMLADRPVDELSGGQRQRVWIAMALTQQTDVLLLDEPTTFLDLANQVEVLDLLTDLNRSRGTTVVMVLHDINLAARYSDHMIAMRGGQVVAAGAPAEVVTEERVREVFGLEAQVVVDPVSGGPLIVPRGRHHARPAERAADAKRIDPVEVIADSATEETP